MTRALLELPTHMRRRLADALEAGQLGEPYGESSLRSVLQLQDGAGKVSAALEAMARNGLDGRAAAVFLRAVEEAGQHEQKPDLVWSGPSVQGVNARSTRQVYEELLGSAEHSVWASSYAYFDGPRAFEVLARRMDEVPTLQVKLLLNVQRRHGDTTREDDLVRRFAERLWQRDWPGTRRPDVFYDPRALDLDGPSGVLHAKAVVTDYRSVYITSANLTEAALDRNIELGVLLRDHALAKSITSHLRALLEARLLVPLPSE